MKKTISIKEKIKDSYGALKAEFGWKNIMQAPKVLKVVVNSGTGSVKDKNKKILIGDRLTKITGQKAAERGAKQSIANFKVRQGDVVGYQVTLRGDRMLSFLDKVVNIALPRTKDFRGLKASAIDEMGNYTLGIKEHTVFPETSDEDLKDVFGLSMTVVTSSKNAKETKGIFDPSRFSF